MRYVLAPLALLAAPAAAQTPVQQRAAALPAILSGKGDPAATFAPAFLAQIPAAKLEALAAQLRAANGAVTGVAASLAGSGVGATR